MLLLARSCKLEGSKALMKIGDQTPQREEFHQTRLFVY
jgi:hypothetical protein